MPGVYARSRRRGEPVEVGPRSNLSAATILTSVHRTIEGPDLANPAEPLVVYIVEDDSSVRNGLSRLMRAAGVHAVAYESPERFLFDVAAKVIPEASHRACILLDITMPRVSGTEVQARLNQLNVTIPVIAISARDDDDVRTRARDLGAHMFLRKPVDDQALFDAIEWVTTAHENP